MSNFVRQKVADRIPDRLERLVFVSCSVPPDGETVISLLDPEIREMAAQQMGATFSTGFTEDIATQMFCNDMDDVQTKFVLDHIGAEAPGIVTEPIDLSGLRHPIPRPVAVALCDHCPRPRVLILCACDAVAVAFVLLLVGELQDCYDVVAHVPAPDRRADAQPQVDHLGRYALNLWQLFKRQPCSGIVALLPEALGCC